MSNAAHSTSDNTAAQRLQARIESLPSHGLFVSFEGIDGSGKSTPIAALGEIFEKAGRELVLTREPGGTPLAEKLRSMVLNDPMDPMSEALLVFAARRDHLANVILPAIERGAVVLSDRFTDSTYAYQGSGRGFSHQVLQTLEQWVQAGVQPDITMLFDLPSEVAAQRRAAVRAPDRFEAEDVAFFDKVRAGYSQRMENDTGRFIRLDALKSREAVWDDLCDMLGDRMELIVKTQEAKAAPRRAAP